MVSGHKSIIGNEKTDELSGKGSETPMYGLESAVGVLKTLARGR